VSGPTAAARLPTEGQESGEKDLFSHASRVRPWLAALVVVAVALPILSTILGLYDRVVHWGKVVHGLEGFLVAITAGLLLLAWRDHERIDLSDQLAVLMTICVGMFVGVMWEIVEFVLDWVRYSDLQKSNSDTMTDLLWNDVGTVVGALLAARLYCHVLRANERSETGQVAVWLIDGPSRVLDRHGFVVSIIVALLVAAAVVALWFAGRPVPGLGTD
jgi:hypothetical protein